MKNTEKDRLKDLFNEIKLENTSNNFMKNLMVQVEKEAIKQQRKKQIFSYVFIAAGVIGIVGIPALILFLMGIDTSFNINLSGIFRGINIEPSYIIFALIILLLLSADMLLRKHVRNS